MKTITTYLKPYRLHIIIAYTLTFIELAADLLFPLILGLMINDGIMTENVDNIIKWGTIMLGITGITFISGIINSYYASHISVQFAYHMREDLFANIQAFTFEQLAKFPSSALVTRFTNDIRQVQNTIFMGLRIMVRAPFMVIGSVLMAFYIDFKISFIFLITVPLLIFFLYWVLVKGSRMFGDVQTSVDNVNQTIQENIAGMRTIRSFVQTDFENKRFSQANKTLAQQSETAFRFVESSMPILLFGMNISLLFILRFGHTQVVAGSTTVGDVVAIVNYALRTVMAISLFTFIALAFSRAKASIERIDVILKEDFHEEASKTEKNQRNAPIQGKIHFEQVSFTYPNAERPTLQNISFTINKGEKIALIGATGAGKTSLFQLIPRLYEPTSGHIFLDDRPLTDFPISDMRDSLGYVPQSPLLFTGTIFDNITFGKADATEAEVVQAAIDAQIHETITQFQDGYHTLVGQKGVNLSGGQKQRISIARALIRKPKILLLDDSTSALDIQTEAALLEAIDTYHCTMLIITQKVSTAKRADRIMLIDHGEMIALGTHAELIKASPLYEEIVTSQTEEVSHVF